MTQDEARAIQDLLEGIVGCPLDTQTREAACFLADRSKDVICRGVMDADLFAAAHESALKPRK